MADRHESRRGNETARIALVFLALASIYGLAAVDRASGHPVAIESCLEHANRDSQRALDFATARDFSAATVAQTQAADGLKKCMLKTKSSTNIDGRVRLGELWMFAGEYAMKDNSSIKKTESHQSALELLSSAEEIFSQLRVTKGLDQTTYDQILFDAHKVSKDLARIGYQNPRK